MRDMKSPGESLAEPKAPQKEARKRWRAPPTPLEDEMQPRAHLLQKPMKYITRGPIWRSPQEGRSLEGTTLTQPDFLNGFLKENGCLRGTLVQLVPGGDLEKA